MKEEKNWFELEAKLKVCFKKVSTFIFILNAKGKIIIKFVILSITSFGGIVLCPFKLYANNALVKVS